MTEVKVCSLVPQRIQLSGSGQNIVSISSHGMLSDPSPIICPVFLASNALSADLLCGSVQLLYNHYNRHIGRGIVVALSISIRKLTACHLRCLN